MPRLTPKQSKHAQRIMEFYHKASGRQKQSLDSIGMQRDDAEKPIIQALEKVGAVVWQMHQPCDLLVRYGHFARRNVNGIDIYLPAYYLLEVERIKPKTRTEEQLALFDFFRVVLVKTPDDALRAIGAVT